MERDNIGRNAGAVWHTLHEVKEGVTFAELMRQINLSAYDVATAIGWLARENKICFTSAEGGRIVLSVYQECYY